MTAHEPLEVVREYVDRATNGDLDVLDDLVATDMVNHASGLQGREGLRTILKIVEHDLGPVSGTTHHLFGDGDLVTQHSTLHGTHRASTMPLLAGVPASGTAVDWEFIHIWRVVNGQIVEHWATRDDMGLLVQLGAGPQTSRS
jgi:lactoylglutathione lyase